MNYLRTIPVRDGVPLKYTVRANELPDPTTQAVIASVVTTRQIGSMEANHLEPKLGTTASNKCNTNTDTCCIGKNFSILEYTRRTTEFYAYEKSLKPIEGVPIMNGTTDWDNPVTQHTYILVINEALYYGNKLKHSLINPNQVRSYGLNIWDNPFDKKRA